MKRKLWIILALAGLIGALAWGTALADSSGQLSSTISWTLTTRGKLTITGSGAMPNYNARTNPSPFTSRMGIRSVVIGSGITRIGTDTFISCGSTVTSVSLPASLDSIGTEAFLNCSGLTAVTLPEGLSSIERYAFGRTGLNSVVIPASVTNVGEYSFYECASLTEAYVLNSSAIFGSQAFGNLSTDFVLYGAAGSTAEAYANNAGIRFGITGSCGTNVTFTLDPADGVLKISGTGPMTDFAAETYVPWNSYSYYINSVLISNGVTRIGNYAFYGCYNMKDVTMPDSVAQIGHDAFGNCSNLISVTIPNGVQSIPAGAFGMCSSLKDVTIPDSVTSIGEYAFYLCTQLAGLTIPDSVQSIGTDAFRSSGLTSVTIPHSVTSIGLGAFTSCDKLTSIRISYNLSRIEADTFSSCVSLHDILIPPSVTIIGQNAFANCSDMTSVTILGGVTSIRTGAFQACSSLTSVTVPGSVTDIGNYAFYNCHGLTDVTILNPNCVIGGGYTDVFKYTSSSFAIHGWPGSTAEIYAQKVGIPFVSLGDPTTGSCGESVTWSFDPSTGTLTISGTGSMTDFTGWMSVPWYSYHSSIMSVSIGSGVTTIGDYAFDGCDSLKNVSIPNSVTRIGRGAFNGCLSLKGMTIPNSVTSIGSVAFNTSGLVSITIPSSVASIGNWAFHNCVLGLTEVTILNFNCVIGDGSHDVFDGCNTPILRGWSGSTAETYAAHTDSNVIFQSLGFPNGSCGDSVTWSIDPSTGTLTINGAGMMQNFSIETDVPWYPYHESITSVRIGIDVTGIGSHAFQNCSSLTSVVILNPDCVIGNSDHNVFQGCPSSLTLVSWAGSTAEVFAANTSPRCGFELLAPAPDLLLPASLTTIEAEAFNGIAAQAVLIPRSVQTIFGNPFENSDVLFIYGFPGTAAEALAQSDPVRFMFFSLTDAWYARLTN